MIRTFVTFRRRFKAHHMRCVSSVYRDSPSIETSSIRFFWLKLTDVVSVFFFAIILVTRARRSHCVIFFSRWLSLAVITRVSFPHHTCVSIGADGRSSQVRVSHTKSASVLAARLTALRGPAVALLPFRRIVLNTGSGYVV